MVDNAEASETLVTYMKGLTFGPGDVPASVAGRLSMQGLAEKEGASGRKGWSRMRLTPRGRQALESVSA